MRRFKIAVACVAVAFASVALAPAPVTKVSSILGIDVLEPVMAQPWTGDQMRGARERLKDILPGSHG